MTCCYCKHDLAEEHGLYTTPNKAWLLTCDACADELRTHQVICATHPNVRFR